MKKFEYSGDEVGRRLIGFSTASIVVGVGILTLPNMLAETNKTSDGWIAILIAGVMSILFVTIIAKLASRFPRKTFYEYSSAITMRPIGFVLTLLYFIYFILFVAYEVRSVSGIASNYLFDKTPQEVVSLIFLLTVIYAVSGSRAALLRLNVIFFPMVLTVVVLVQVMSFNYFDMTNLQPMIVTDLSGIWEGAKKCSYSFLGFEVLLFYIAYMDRPKDASKAAVSGLFAVILLYLGIYIFSIGIFSQEGTANLVIPTIEIAKEIKVPGQFFERFESVFLTIWFMTVFNTASMAFDVATIAVCSVFKKLG